MIAHYLKIAFKNLWNNKKYSAINILGFGFSLSIFLAIILFVIHEYSFDRYHANSKNIFRLMDSQETSSEIDYRVRDILLNNFAGVENVCYFSGEPADWPISSENEGYNVKGLASVHSSFFEMFDTEFIYGNAKIPFQNLNSAIITESLAEKVFGKINPVGKELLLMGNFPIIVTGVIRDFPANSSFVAQMIVNAENDDFKFSFSCEDYEDESTHRWPFQVYIQKSKDTDQTSLLETINGNIESLQPYVKEAGLLPLTDMYLQDPTPGESIKRGNPGLLKLLFTIALIILILAIINYINLTLAQQQRRNKEVGIRKTIGASSGNIIKQFILEGIIVVLIAFGLSLLIFEIASPLINNLFKVPLSALDLLPFPTSGIVLTIVILIGLFTGFYPAMIFASFNPINILGRNPSTKGSRNYSRNFLTVFQFAVSIALIFCAIVIWKQIDYSKHKDLGFQKDQLLKIPLPPHVDPAVKNMSVGFVNELRQYSGIKNVTASRGVPGEVVLHMGSGIEGKNKGIAIISVDSTFLETFGMEIIQGRGFLSGDHGKACLLNKTAMEYFEWEDLENKVYNNGREKGYEVVGVVNDFHISSIHDIIEPTALLFDTRDMTQVSLSVGGGEIGKTMDYIRRSWKTHLPEFPLNYDFYDDWFNTMYEKEERFGKIISYFTVLGIVISCIGIFGLAIFNAERKTKEIGIRKVNGASVKNILAILTREYFLWILLAFIMATPLAYYIMDTWLQGFAYRTDISWWIFPLAGLSALLIAWLSVIWHSLKAAKRNPVETLRYE